LLTIEEVVAQCAVIADPGAHDPARTRAWRGLVERGRSERPFAGAVRGIAEQSLGMTWDEIVAFDATLR
jgi:hypothetical protein